MAISVTFDNGAFLFFIIIFIIFVIYSWLKLMKMISNSKKALKSLAEKYSMDYVEDASDLVLNDTSYSYSIFVIIKKLKSKVSFKIEKAIPIFGTFSKVKYEDLTPIELI